MRVLLSATALLLVKTASADGDGAFVPDNCGDETCLVEQVLEGDCSNGVVCDKGSECHFAYKGYVNSTEGEMLDQKSEEDNWWVKIGIGNLLPGMDAGYEGMCPGEIRKVTMAPVFHWDGHAAMKTPPVAK